MQRRQFLGAAAAAASLPAVAEGDDPDLDEIIEGGRESDDGTYQDADCGSVPGSLTRIGVGAEMNDGPISVTGYRDGDNTEVAIQWSSGAVSVGTGIAPDDARELADRLRVAAAFADGELNEGDFPEDTDGE